MSSSCAVRAPRCSPYRPVVVDDSSDVRAGDIDRERTAGHLGQAFTQGYLSMDEYETRLRRAFAATNARALRHLTDDLPIKRISRRDPRCRTARLVAARHGVRIHLIVYLAMSVAAISIWLAVGLTAGAWYFWPIWPILGGGIGILSHAIPIAVIARSVDRS